MRFVPAERAEPIVTVPEMGGREPIVTLLPTVTVPEIGTKEFSPKTSSIEIFPLCIVKELPTVTVPAIRGREPMVTLLPTVTVPEMGRGLALSKFWLAKFTIKKPSSVTFSFNCSSFASSYPNKFAVTVPEMAGSEPMVTLLPTVTLPIWAVPAPRVTVPEIGIFLFESFTWAIPASSPL